MTKFVSRFSPWKRVAPIEEGGTSRVDVSAIVKENCRLDIVVYSFSQRTINEWNKLSTDCVNARHVNMFKKKSTDIFLVKLFYICVFLNLLHFFLNFLKSDVLNLVFGAFSCCWAVSVTASACLMFMRRRR